MCIRDRAELVGQTMQSDLATNLDFNSVWYRGCSGPLYSKIGDSVTGPNLQPLMITEFYFYRFLKIQKASGQLIYQQHRQHAEYWGVC